eukprot:77818_1
MSVTCQTTFLLLLFQISISSASTIPFMLLLIHTQTQTATSQTKYCDTAYQCVGQSININRNMYSRGYKGVYGPTTSINTKRIACLGTFSCYNVSLLSNSHSTVASDDVECSGASSCAYNGITYGLYQLYCTGVSS